MRDMPVRYSKDDAPKNDGRGGGSLRQLFFFFVTVAAVLGAAALMTQVLF